MKKRSSSRFRAGAMLLVFFASAFLLPASRDGNTILYLLSAVVPGVMLLLLLLPSRIFPLDRPSLCAVLPLCGFSLLATAAYSPDGTLSQGFRCVAALLFLAAGAVLIRAFRPSVPSAALPAFCGLGLLSCSIIFQDPPFSFTEGGMALVLFSAVAFLSLRLRLPALLAALGALLLLLLQQDYGSAAVWGVSCVLLFWVAADSPLWSVILFCSVGSLLGIFAAISPFSADPAGFSPISRLAAMPLIPPETLPEVSPAFPPEDLFFMFGEQYGLIILLCAVLLVILFLIRGASLAQHARKAFHAALSFGVVLLIGLRMLLFLSSAAGLAPFSPGSFPFLTSSLPDLFSHFFLAGLLSGISARNENDLEEDARLAMLAR